MKSLKIYLSKNEFGNYNEVIKIASESIIEAQDYVRSKNDVSSVSLRDIRRFIIFYNFFVDYLRNKKKIYSNMQN